MKKNTKANEYSRKIDIYEIVGINNYPLHNTLIIDFDTNSIDLKDCNINYIRIKDSKNSSILEELNIVRGCDFIIICVDGIQSIHRFSHILKTARFESISLIFPVKNKNISEMNIEKNITYLINNGISSVFYRKDFILVKDLWSNQGYLTSQIGTLINQTNYYEYSLSWKLTKPLRIMRKVCTCKHGIKSMVKSTPLLSSAFRYIYNRIKSLENYILDKTTSSQNIALINQFSSKRGKYIDNGILTLKKVIEFPDSNLPILNISIVTYNNGRWLEQFFNSLINQNYPVNKISLHFVDNSSTDNTLNKLEEYRARYNDKFHSISIYVIENLGFGSGHDHAIKHINGDYVLISNIDLEFEPTSIVNIMKYALQDKDNVASWELMQRPYEHPKYYDPITLETSWNSHACVLIKLDAYNKVGGYHPNIFMYGEDVELSYRFRAFGYSLKYVPFAPVNHYTYEEVNQVKPLQFSGSTKANMLLRLRYGNKADIWFGYFLQFALLFRGSGFEGSKKIVFNNIINIFKQKKYFNKIKGSEKTFFPFRGFDYEMSRKGAFYDLLKEKAEINEYPLVSIVTRTYKGREKFLKECISSVLNQTYPKIEHIIVEDGGNTMETLISDVVKNNPSYSVRYQACEKKGRSYIGNKGVEISKGRYCLFLDDDDLIFPDHISILVDAIYKNTNVKASYSLAWEVLTEIKSDNSYIEREYRFNDIFEQEFDREKLLKYNYIPIQCILFSKDLFDNYGGFEEDMDQLEDWNLWTKYALVSNFKFVNKITSLYRTPYSINIRNERAAKLDAAYQDALKKQRELLKKYAFLTKKLSNK